jgi:tripartite-type tricarboxylate transporter receptor subunit TctC
LLQVRALRAQAYPSRPVHVIVGTVPGSSPDIIARLLGQRLSARLGQRFIIENRPGAGGNIGTEAVVRAPADGHTLLLVTTANTISTTFYDNLAFNFMRDIAPAAAIVRVPNVLMVHPSVPATTVAELIAYAKAHPGKVNMASSGNGTTSHVSGEMFKMMTGSSLGLIERAISAAPKRIATREIDVAEQAIKRISELAIGKNMSRIKVGANPLFCALCCLFIMSRREE